MELEGTSKTTKSNFIESILTIELSTSDDKTNKKDITPLPKPDLKFKGFWNN